MFTSFTFVKIFRIIFSYIFFLTCVYFINGCASKEAPIEEKPIFLEITLYDDFDNKVPDAQVYIFENKADYEKTSVAYVAINANDSTKSDANGIAKIKIESAQTLYLYIIRNEPVRNVVLTNEGQNNIINIPSKNVNISINIKLTPTNGNIAFFTFGNGILNKVPIDITLSGVSFQLKKSLTINDFAVALPTTIFETGVVSNNSRFGTFKYQAKNADGCVWTGFITLRRGQFLPVELPKCEKGVVEFTTNNIPNRNNFPATIQLNGTNYGEINPAAGVNTFSFPLEPGFYTYLIRPNSDGTNSDCVWTGSFEITTDQTKSVLLEKCK